MDSPKPLFIYSASAGSGKTFNLVQHFLKLTLAEEGAHQKFSKILAMTFTNKAAWEMKERIVEALDLIAHPEFLTEKELSNRKKLLPPTLENLQLKEDVLQSRAQQLLRLLLHNYEAFNILTIDKFNLRLIRTFAKELNISHDVQVVIDEKMLLEKVVDDFLSNIGKKGFEELTKTAINYVKSNISDGDKWDFRKSLIDFSSVLLDEKNQPFLDTLLQKEYSPEIYNELYGQIKLLESKYEQLKKKLHTTFTQCDLQEEDLPKKGKGMFGYYSKKLLHSSLKAPCSIGKTGAKTLDGTNLNKKHNFPSELRSETISFLEQEEQLKNKFFTLNSIRKNFYNLALLKYLSKQLEDYRKRDNIILISDFNKMVASLLQEENTDFIYERLGTRFNHYLLDEFQDTSRLQWLNLIPLLEDAIANGYFNLIVGDPKQAIYRFRSGLVKQFTELPRIYNPENEPKLEMISDQFSKMGVKSDLKHNWRSRQNIVNFNNTFFANAKKYLSEGHGSYFDDVKQIPAGESGGYVEFNLFESNIKEEVENREKEFILSTIRSLEKEGYKRGDICLLARKKDEGRRWASILNNAPEKYKVISVDSLSVSSDQLVKLFIHYLLLRINPSNKTYQVGFAVKYLMYKDKDAIEVLNNYWIDEKVGALDFKSFLVDFFATREKLFFEYENLFDFGRQFQNVIKALDIYNPYLHHLMEMLHDYDLHSGPDLRSFYTFWEETGHKETVQMPKNEHAIQIMTAHKAKGLEFPVVILPSFSWDFNKIRGQYFIENDEDIIYTSLIKNEDKAPQSIIDAYYVERADNLLDQFNLLYVAMTRAVDRFYGLLNTKRGQEINEISNIVHETLENISQNSEEKDRIKNTDEQFIYGVKEHSTEAKETTPELDFLPANVADTLWFPEMALQDEEALEKEELSEEQRYGNQLHLLLAEINTVDEIEPVAKTFLLNEKIDKALYDELIAKCKSIFKLESYISLLNASDQVLNEQSILVDIAVVKRPDKLFISDKGAVVLDFKTGKELQKHKEQLFSYVQALKEMGIEKVEAKILYTESLKLVDVY